MAVKRRFLGRLTATGIVVLLATAGAAWWAMREPGRSASPGIRVPLVTRGVRAPEGARVRVEVINATSTRGLARRAMRQLRDAGFDVVDMGTSAASARRDTTLVLSRSGHDDWATLVSELLGGARVESRPDSSRYLDVTVLLGTSYRPPAQTLYP